VAVDVVPESVAWSADGATLFFTYRTRDAFAIGAVAAAGGEWRRVGESPGEELREPFVDATTGTLLVQLQRHGVWSLAELPLTGGVARPLTPPGFATSTRGSRARNGVVVFESSAAGRAAA
jgi:hypothetical protein